MVTPQADELQNAFFARLGPKLAENHRIRAAWLEGSFGRGDADRYSDIDLHLLLEPEYATAFQGEAEVWLSSIQPLVLFKRLFDGQIINALAADGLRIDVWLHEGDTVERDGAKVLLLHALPDSLQLIDGPDETVSPDRSTTLGDQIREFWRCIALLPSVLGRGELIVAQMGVAIELRLLTDVLIDGYSVERDSGVKKLNALLPGDTRDSIENALSIDGLSNRSVALSHLRLAAVMKHHGPIIAARHNFQYPNELEHTVFTHVAMELENLGLAECLVKAGIATSEVIR